MKDVVTFPDFVKLDLRIGTVVSAEKVEKSQKLVRLQVDLGVEIGMKQIVAGIAEKYDCAELVNKQVVVVVNLEPRKMMGLTSEGMMLAAGDEIVSLLTPDKKMVNGSVVR